jgi:hypothetical protein
MAVRGVLAQANVRHQHQLFCRARLFSACSPLHNAVVGPGSSRLLVFAFGQSEEQDASDAQRRGSLDFFHRLVDREVEDSRHGTHLAPHAFARADEQGIDQVSGFENGFPH